MLQHHKFFNTEQVLKLELPPNQYSIAKLSTVETYREVDSNYRIYLQTPSNEI